MTATASSSASRPRRTATRAPSAPAVRFSPPDDARRGRATSPPRATDPPPASPAPGQFVATLDDSFLSCRGDRHSFPKLRARNGKLPRGISVSRQHDGCFSLTFVCPDCGTERTRVTLPGGRYDPAAAYTYRYPPGYLSPRDSGLLRSDFTAELVRRVFEGGLFR